MPRGDVKGREAMKDLLGRIARWSHRFSFSGLVLGILAFAASTTPSLIPRGWLYQGVISGFSLIIGYAIGTSLRAIAARFGLTAGPSPAHRVLIRRILLGGGAVVVLATLVTGTASQRRLATLWGLEQTPEAHLMSTAVLALGLALGLLFLGRALRRAVVALGRVLARWLPKQAAGALAFLAVTGLVVGTVSGIFEDVVLSSLTSTFTARDSTSRDGVTEPTSSTRSGSQDSLQAWDTLGFEGRTFVTGGPTVEEIEAETGRPAIEPIRVYAGLASPDESAEVDFDALAAEVVAELDRTNAWDRAVVAVGTTTGTGWVDPLSVTALEYLQGGDTAIAAMQYSVNPSWVTLVLDIKKPAEAGTALFEAVHARWNELPVDDRPQLVPFGVSLGSYGSQAAFNSLDSLTSRATGAVWAGTPMFTPLWADLTASRDAGSPEIHPVLDGGETVRWATQNGGDQFLDSLGPADLPRVAYLQHPSDGVVWWWWPTAWHRDEWFTEPHGQDVIAGVRWWPVVTGLQLLGDMFVAGSSDVPLGYGHNYGSGYVDSWYWVTQPDGWDEASIEQLRQTVISSVRPG